MNLISPFNKGKQKTTRNIITCISISGWATEQIYFKHSMTCNCLKKGPILDENLNHKEPPKIKESGIFGEEKSE